MSDIAQEGVPQYAPPQAPAPAPAPAGWTPPTQQEFQEIVEAFWTQRAQLEAADAYLRDLETNVPEPQAPPQVDDDDFDVEAEIQRRVDAAVAASLQSNPVIVQQQEERGMKVAEGLFTQFESKIGAFDHGTAYLVAEGILRQNPQMDPREALARGAMHVKQTTEQARQQVAQSYGENLQRRDQMIVDLPANTGYAQPGERPAGNGRRIDYRDVSNDYFARRGQVTT